MDRKLASAIASGFSSPNAQVAFEEYVAHRLNLLRNLLEETNDEIEVRRLQGSISEVKRLLKIREQAQNTLKVS